MNLHALADLLAEEAAAQIDRAWPDDSGTYHQADSRPVQALCEFARLANELAAMADRPPLRNLLQECELMRPASKRLARRLAVFDATFACRLAASQHELLGMLADEGPCDIYHLADLAGKTHITIYSQMQRLVEAGLVDVSGAGHRGDPHVYSLAPHVAEREREREREVSEEAYAARSFRGHHQAASAVGLQPRQGSGRPLYALSRAHRARRLHRGCRFFPVWNHALLSRSLCKK